MNAVKKIVTGGAYENPAKTVDGAFTKQGEHNAHTIEGTSADPNSTGSKLGDAGNKAAEAGQKAKQEGEQTAQKDGKQEMNKLEGDVKKDF